MLQLFASLSIPTCSLRVVAPIEAPKSRLWLAASRALPCSYSQQLPYTQILSTSPVLSLTRNRDNNEDEMSDEVILYDLPL